MRTYEDLRKDKKENEREYLAEVAWAIKTLNKNKAFSAARRYVNKDNELFKEYIELIKKESEEKKEENNNE